MRRREFLGAVGAASAIGLAGCSYVLGSDDSAERAHTVSVYLSDRELTRKVTVTVTDEDGTSLFENEYTLSDSNEADEDATFLASKDPDTILVTVDGTRFEREWPGFEHPELPCNDPNHAGIEIWVEQSEDRSPEIRLEVNCQSVGMEGRPV
jgi:hypothetical protein